MEKTNSDPKNVEPDLQDDDIEIIEVVGLDEDSPAARPRAALSEEPVPQSSDDVLVEFDAGIGVDDPVDLPESLPESTPGGAAPEDERLLRLTADFENFQRRVDREREAHRIHASAQLIDRLLPVLDNFERALDAARQAGGNDGFQNGIALIFRQLLDELRKEGLTAVDTVGEPFDPTVHEAVVTATNSALPPNTIVEELQRGYLLHDRLLRPALVRVNLDPSSAADTADGSGEG